MGRASSGSRRTARAAAAGPGARRCADGTGARRRTHRKLKRCSVPRSELACARGAARATPPGADLDYLGLARCDLGDPTGLTDYREALTIATDAGQGHEAAVIYANLGETLSMFEGPVAALELLRQGIAFAQARGVTSLVKYITPSTLDPLFDCGELDEALELAASIADRLEDGTDQLTLVVLAQRGPASRPSGGRSAATRTRWIGSRVDSPRSRGARVCRDWSGFIIGRSRAAWTAPSRGGVACRGRGDPRRARGPGLRPYLPAMVRTALTVASPQLASLISAGVERTPRWPATRLSPYAPLTRRRGEHQTAADGGAGRRTLVSVRSAPRAGVRAARSGPRVDRTRSSNRSRSSARAGA